MPPPPPRQGPDQGPTGQKRKAAADFATNSGEKQLFSGCTLVFWATSHMQHMQQRVRQLGGSLQPALTPSTTHVVCAPATTVQQAADRLRGGKTTTAAGGPELPGTGVRLPAHCAFVTPDWVSKSILRQQLQQTDQFQPAFAKEAAAADAEGAGGAGAAAAAAAAVEVEGAGVAGQDGSSLGRPPPQLQQQQQRRQQQGEHVQGHPAAAAPAAAQQQQAQQQQQQVAEGTYSSTTVPFDPQQQWATQQDLQMAAPGRGDTAEGPQVPCRVDRRGSEFVAIQGVKPQYTGGATGIPWGSFGVWDEPYDPVSARQTLDKLRQYWFHTHDSAQQAPTTIPQPPAGDLNGVCSHVCCSRRPFCIVAALLEIKKVYLEGRGADQFKMKAIDRAAQQLVQWGEPLQSEQDVDRVGLATKSAAKVKEIVVSGVSSRLQAAQQDEQLQVVNSFLEVWGVGAAVAARWYAAGCRTLDDVRRRAGIAADSVAAAGLAGGTSPGGPNPHLHLTEQQRVGIKYFEDFQHKIPRAEVAVAEAIVREQCFSLLEQRGAPDVERTYCFATGSYRRGKPESSDVDILCCLPPSMEGASAGTFLTELLKALLACGLLVDEMRPTEPHLSFSGNSASWMGVCRPYGAPCFRRIDVKVYGPQYTPFAVNYFANSQAFCRATRYWGNHAVPEAARRVNPAATGFKISDKEMVPIVKGWHAGGGGRSSRGSGRRRGAVSSDSEEEAHPAAAAAAAAGTTSGADATSAGGSTGTTVLGPAVPCTDETAIFRELGLAYVPVHMRFFHDYF